MKFLYKSLYLGFSMACCTPALAQLPELDWHKTFVPAEPGARAVIGGIKTSLDGNIVVYGQLTGAMDADLGPGTRILNPGDGHAFFAKYDPQGNLLWARNLAVSIHTWDLNPETGWITYCAAFNGEKDFDPGAGSHILTGDFNSLALVRLDADGMFKGANDIQIRVGIKDLAIDKRGRVFLTGFLYDNTDFDPSSATLTVTPYGSNDGFVAVYDQSLQIQQAYAIGGSYEDVVNCITMTADGFALGGRFSGSASFDPGGGGMLTTKKATGFIAHYTYSGAGVALKNVVQMGAEVEEIALDPKTSMLSVSGVIGDSVDVDPGPGVRQLYPIGKQDVFVSHTRADGSFGFGKAFSTGTSRPTAETMPSLRGGVFYAGSIYKALDVNVGQPNGAFTPVGASDLFVCKFREDGTLRYGFSIGVAGATTMGQSVVTSNGAIILVGMTSGTLDLDPGNGVALINPNAENTTFLARYKDENTLGIAPREVTGVVEIHSSERSVIIDFSSCSNVNADIALSDLSGRTIFRTNHRSADMRRLDLGDIAPGFYIVTVQDGPTRVARKISVH